MFDACAKLGRPFDSGVYYKEQMEKAGFENVTEIVNKWPTRGWPKDPKMKEIGKMKNMFLYLARGVGAIGGVGVKKMGLTGVCRYVE